MMLRFALNRAVTTATRTSRLFNSSSSIDPPQHDRVARQMIQYALGHARSQKSGDSYAQAIVILEQGMSNLKGGDSSDDAMGMFMLGMSTLLYERGEIQDAVEKLQMVHQLECASPAVRVAASEGLVGLKLEAGQDSTSSKLANDCFKLLTNSLGAGEPSSDALKLRAKAAEGLVHLVLGELQSAESSFDGCEKCNLEDSNDQLGNASLSNAEFLHVKGKFLEAKDLYEKVLYTFDTKDVVESSYLASANMVPEEVLLGATCALGQLLSHSGKFGEAEDLLTKALTKAEEHFGSTHPKVGVVLTCIAMMFKHKARLEASSSILIQEGLYRRAIDLLKAPGMESEVANIHTAKRDIVALARGGYAEILCIQQNRKGEGEQLKNWAEAAWKNRRLSLAEALDFSQPSLAPIIDTRICRVL